MNRLWMRFSVLISSFFLILIMLPLGTLFVLDQLNIVSIGDDDATEDDRWIEDLPKELFVATSLVALTGIALGVWLSRGLSAPIVELSTAVRQIGAGDLSQRVPIKQHSRELDDLAASFNSMATSLEQSEAQRNQLLADISHELRTPLTVLSGQLRAALDRVYALDDAELANLYGQTKHLIRLVEDLRVLAQAEARHLPLNIAPTDLRLLWSELTDNFAPLAEEKQVAFRMTMPTLIVAADPFRLRQIFTNLLANALRHTPTNGSITVTGQKIGQQAAISIRDDGEGIAATHLPHLFDRFYRVDRSRSRDTGGSGLGLAITKALVEAHRGEIAVESAGAEQGSTFTVYLPINALLH